MSEPILGVWKLPEAIKVKRKLIGTKLCANFKRWHTEIILLWILRIRNCFRFGKLSPIKQRNFSVFQSLSPFFWFDSKCCVRHFVLTSHIHFLRRFGWFDSASQMKFLCLSSNTKNLSWNFSLLIYHRKERLIEPFWWTQQSQN